MNKHVKAIFDKEMNRKEFLGHIGAFLLAAAGISGIIRYFLQGGESGGGSSGHHTSGYGGGAYGGKSKP